MFFYVQICYFLDMLGQTYIGLDIEPEYLVL
jgi:hypothetical protein